ncbi:MAG: insulinase family protein [Nannocystaceae bacterium]|nr:insulinase family protein [Nannocystaceae bacterium]
MIWTRRSMLAGFGAATLTGCSKTGSRRRPPTTPNVLRVAVPQAQRTRLDSGARLYFAEDRTVPLVAVAVTIPAGLRHDPANIPGVASMAIGLLLDHENQGRTARFAELGATLVGNIADSTAVLQCTVRRADAPAALRLLVDSVRNLPTDTATFERVRSHHLGALESLRGSPANVAGLGVVLGSYGVSPPTRVLAAGTPHSVGGVSVGYVRQWHADRARPGGANFAVAGDASLEEATRWVEEAAAHWSTDAGPKVGPAAPQHRKRGPRVVLVPWPMSQQCTIAYGGRRAAPDSADAMVEKTADAVISGAVTSVLRTSGRMTYGTRPENWTTRFGRLRYDVFTIERFDVEPAVHALNILSEWLLARPLLDYQEIDGARQQSLASLMAASTGPENMMRRLLAWADRDLDPPSAEYEIKTREGLTLLTLEKAMLRLSRRARLRICVVGDRETIDHAHKVLGSDGVEERTANALIGDTEIGDTDG